MRGVFGYIDLPIWAAGNQRVFSDCVTKVSNEQHNEPTVYGLTANKYCKKYCLVFRLPAKTDALLERPCAVTVTIFCDVSEGLICRTACFAACLPKWSRLKIVKWTLADRKRKTYGLEK